MPTYCYKCSNDHCTYEIDIFHKMSEERKPLCPYCGHKMLKQIGSGSGIIFKGDGFFRKDYPKDRK